VKPEELRYAKTHEWVHLQKQGAERIATVGISAFALEALTDLVYIELPTVGRELEAGEPFGEIESVKAVSDLYSPVTGEVVEVHQQISDKLDTLNDDPYGEGWLIKVRLTGDKGLNDLVDFETYQRQCAEEGH
jgi:glycine cleavage system H protein